MNQSITTHLWAPHPGVEGHKHFVPLQGMHCLQSHCHGQRTHGGLSIITATAYAEDVLGWYVVAWRKLSPGAYGHFELGHYMHRCTCQISQQQILS